jgi:TonB family protein
MLEFIKKHKRGLIGTIAFHGILVILFFSMGFSTPLPLPAEKGVLINFGNVEDASGNTELQKSPQQSQKESQPQKEQTSQEESKPVQQDEEKIVTQDHEEAPAVKEKTTSQPKQQETQKEDKPDKNTEPEQQEKQEKREVNRKALYPGKSKDETSSSEGETKGKGNQGKESGSPLSDNHAQKGSKGMGGIDYTLQGRNPESLPKPDYNYQVEGKVVVEITVDKYGNVTKAVPGAKGSTTLNDNLLRAAKKAALNAKFDRKPSAPAYQKGTITYFFKLQ